MEGSQYITDNNSAIEMVQRGRWNALVAVGDHFGIDANPARACGTSTLFSGHVYLDPAHCSMLSPPSGQLTARASLGTRAPASGADWCRFAVLLSDIDASDVVGVFLHDRQQ